MNLALFDFDGTITSQDTYTKFVVAAAGRTRLYVGGFVLLPIILLYKLGIVSAPRVRPLISKVAFWRSSESKVVDIANTFVSEYLPTVLRDEMLEKIAEHKANGDKVVIVSASLSPYLKIWCNNLDVGLICSELEVRNGILTGSYLSGDCSKERKVENIRKTINLNEFDTIYAYGDTEEDIPMLNLADLRYYQGKLVLEKTVNKTI
ncbi:HAD family hydrolase [Shewanella salipaludis]|uniref:HAD family hydrolase n=1 Tax=Shewanella salipaludis TaxID=2723052 RepID=A0A972FVC4_9GAMM|nr:HAD family hydrolase [Shewanella salipaludis]NMH66282.1 HAD family hydrolase [Shewanella salipaludis]